MCNSPMREELKLLNNRLELAKKRREAIDLEAKQLDLEIPHLEALIDLYSKKLYDSIVEERRVTKEILKTSGTTDSPKPDPEQSSQAEGGRRKSSPKGLLLKTMLEIFYESDKGISHSNLCKEMNKRMGYKVANNGIYTNLKKLTESTDAERVVKHYEMYILAEYLKDDADTQKTQENTM